MKEAGLEVGLRAGASLGNQGARSFYSYRVFSGGWLPLPTIAHGNYSRVKRGCLLHSPSAKASLDSKPGPAPCQSRLGPLAEGLRASPQL